MKKILVLIVCLFSISIIAQEDKEKPLKYKDIKNDEIKSIPINLKEIELPDTLLKQLNLIYNKKNKSIIEEINAKLINNYTTIDSVVKVK